MRKNKKLAILLYLVYAAFLILFITYGSSAGSYVARIIRTKLNEKEIVNVTVDVGDGADLLANKTYYLQFKAEGDFSGDAGLIYESLSPEYVEINSRGAVEANMKFEGDALEAKIKVTSKYDKDFEKVFTFRFIKKCPDEFIAAYYVKGYEHAVKKLHIGIPVYVFSHTTESSSSYNIKDYAITYDEEYFEMREDGALVPIKVTPDGVSLKFGVVYENGRSDETTAFTISEPAKEITEIDEIRLADKYTDPTPLDEFTCYRGCSTVVRLYNDGKQVMTDYTVTCDEDNIKFTDISHIYFSKPGDKHLTFTLPNGFEYKCVLKVRNYMKAPTLNDKEVNQTHVIKMLDTDVKTFKMTYSSKVTYESAKFEYDSSMISVKYDKGSFTITGKSHGTTTLKLILDDGYTRVEDIYTIELQENKDVAAMLLKNLAKFVAKVLGHMTLFAALGFISMNMFRYLNGIYRTIDRFVIFILTGLPSAALTEFIQLYMPGRSGRWQDVLIDMTGFFIGALVFITISVIIRRYIAKRDREWEALKTLRQRRDENRQFIEIKK